MSFMNRYLRANAWGPILLAGALLTVACNGTQPTSSTPTRTATAVLGGSPAAVTATANTGAAAAPAVSATTAASTATPGGGAGANPARTATPAATAAGGSATTPTTATTPATGAATIPGATSTVPAPKTRAEYKAILTPLLARLNAAVTNLTQLSTDAQIAMVGWKGRVDTFGQDMTKLSKEIDDVPPPACLLDANNKIAAATLDVGVAGLELSTIADAKEGNLPNADAGLASLRTRIGQLPRSIADASAAIDSAVCP